MEKTFKVLPPKMPQYIQLDKPAGLRQDGISFDKGIPIRDLTRDEALEYAELMKETFMKHWENQSDCHIGLEVK